MFSYFNHKQNKITEIVTVRLFITPKSTEEGRCWIRQNREKNEYLPLNWVTKYSAVPVTNRTAATKAVVITTHFFIGILFSIIIWVIHFTLFSQKNNPTGMSSKCKVMVCSLALELSLSHVIIVISLKIK